MSERNARLREREDHRARDQALDITASLLVQAPAGSGKTELLIQRYLALLAHVDEPEHIVALTFTRKAAGEMRERVIKALAQARADAPVGERHEQLTRRLAQAALAQDARRGWSISDHPARLALYTFDALATSIAQRAPVAARLGPRPQYLDDASAFYAAAASEDLARAPADDRHWRRLLRHLDNDAARAIAFIGALLGRRDQWLRQLVGQSTAALRAALEHALRDEITAALQATREAFPEDLRAEVVRLAGVAGAGLGARDEEAVRGLGKALAACATCGELPAASHDALEHWATLGRWLLVGPGTHFRKSITRNEGFPPGARGSDAETSKAAMSGLCERLNAVPGLAGTLLTASRLPSARLGEDAWEVVEALLALLPRVVGRLRVAFAEQASADFVQANLAALDALGTDEAPSDLLLKLDARVMHLLVDEFQDTSFTQLKLLSRLTDGWVPGDGRTIFAVGDPMQSIYRFREAEVRLFVLAQQQGRIGHLPVRCLVLRRNFRSQAHLVGWVNGVFPMVLGGVNDPGRGAVAFADAVAARPAIADVESTLDLALDADEEAARVIARVREAQAAGSTEVAILVRARPHLDVLLPSLRKASIAFAAVDLDSLAERQATIDLASLTYALAQPGDRTAWLAVLRAPWCGLLLADLFALHAALPGERDASLSALLDDVDAVPGLSADGAARLARVALALRPALASRGRASLAARVRSAWLALGAPACVDDPIDLEAAECFFALLAEHEQGGELVDRDGFASALAKLRAAPRTPEAAGVQVMTMHKAKGLEFDTVILCGLARKPPSHDAALLRWRQREAGLLIAPAKARGGDDEPLYAYLGTIAEEEADAELARLLYVACTRAKSRLHLVAAPGVAENRKTGERVWKTGPKGSSLAKLWPAIACMAPPLPDAKSMAHGGASAPPPLVRLPGGARIERPLAGLRAPEAVPMRDDGHPPFDWAAETARRTGIVAHRLLSRLDGAAPPDEHRLAAMERRARADLASAGLLGRELDEGTRKVMQAVRRTLADAKGRWIFDGAHDDVRNEWGLAGLDEGAIVHVVLDRTFVAGGERWIVDFKTGTHEGGDAERFLASEAERYCAQMRRYGRLMRQLEGGPVRLALYYPLVEGGFREIPA